VASSTAAVSIFFASPKSSSLTPCLVTRVLAVRGVQSVEDLSGVGDDLVERQRASERLAFHQFHHQVVRPDVIELANVGMVQGGDGAGLAFEAIGEPLRCDFDRHHAVQPGVAGLPDFTHAAGADRRQDLVGAQPSSGGKPHRVSNDYSVQGAVRR
jgi:hypothetical protein